MSGCTARRYEQLETYPETIEQELRPAVCEHRQTDANYANANYANYDVNLYLGVCVCVCAFVCACVCPCVYPFKRNSCQTAGPTGAKFGTHDRICLGMDTG